MISFSFIQFFILSTLLLSQIVNAVPFRLASIFGNNMVLQYNKPIAIWGWSKPTSPVYGVFMNPETNVTVPSTSTSDATGFFVLNFPPQNASSGVWRLLVGTNNKDEQRCEAFQFYCSGATTELSGIAFGDVVMCIGQSNMQVNVNFAFNSSEELNYANKFSNILKIFQVSATATANDGPLDDFSNPPSIPWSPASNTTLGEFSATCYFSAKSILLTRPAAAQNIPLGLVSSPWGGTGISAWNPLSVNATCAPYFPSGEPFCGLLHAPCNASTLFNSMYAPIFGPANSFPVSAFIWFQGENDANLQEIPFFYPCQLTNLASSLRQVFNAQSAHWVTMQLAPYTGGSALPPFRSMQCNTTWNNIPDSSCAILVDDGDVLSPIGTVHSRNKQLVGERVAQLLNPVLFGAPFVADRGPQFASNVLAANGGILTADVYFTPSSLAGGGLTYVAPFASTYSNSTRCPVELNIVRETDCDWISIIGSDSKAYNATVTINPDGKSLHLVAQAVNGITAIGTRYGWGPWPVVNYYSSVTSLPMIPWCTNC